MSSAIERIPLDATSWVDLGRGWLAEADELYEALQQEIAWKPQTVRRYDHMWEGPRLGGFARPGIHAPHPAVTRIHKWLRSTYGVELTGASLVKYRDGNDSMGAHRDGDLRWCENTLVAIVNLGAKRSWTLAPRRDREAVIDLLPDHGDVFVMGGRAQADWVHAVPKAPGAVGTRISMQWRWTSRTGRPEVGASSHAPRRYGSGR